jgi:hypothetical protein
MWSRYEFVKQAKKKINGNVPGVLLNTKSSHRGKREKEDCYAIFWILFSSFSLGEMYLNAVNLYPIKNNLFYVISLSNYFLSAISC